MRFLRIPAVITLFAAFPVSCTDQPVPTGLGDSQVSTTTLDSKAEHDYLVREFLWDWPSEDVITCANDGAGEILMYDGIVVAATRKLWTGSPMQTRSTKIIEFKGLNFDHFQATGQTSGDVWVINPRGSTWTARWNADPDAEFWNWHQTYSFKFTNQDGDRLHLQGKRVEKVDKNGELVLVEYNRGSCPDVWVS